MDTVVYDAYPKVELSEFTPELLLEIPELSEDILMHYVRKAAIEFCERSRVVEREIQICMQACVPNYLLESPDCTRVVSVTGICRGCGGPYSRINGKPCHNDVTGGVAWWDQREGTIWVHPAPSQDNNIMVRVSVAPEQDACEVDAILNDKYREAILAGARMFIYAVPRREWTSQSFADSNRAEFDRRVAAAGTDRLLGGQQGSVRMKNIFHRR